MNVEEIACVAHEANRAYCCLIKDFSKPPWTKSKPAQQEYVKAGVRYALDGTRSREEVHDKWLEVMEAAGWKHGKKRHVGNRTHPCMLPYDELPESQKLKDALFLAIVDALKDRTA